MKFDFNKTVAIPGRRTTRLFKDVFKQLKNIRLKDIYCQIGSKSFKVRSEIFEIEGRVIYKGGDYEFVGIYKHDDGRCENPYITQDIPINDILMRTWPDRLVVESRQKQQKAIVAITPFLIIAFTALAIYVL